MKDFDVISTWAANDRTYALGDADKDGADHDLHMLYRINVVGWALVKMRAGGANLVMPLTCDGVVSEDVYVIFPDGRVEGVNNTFPDVKTFTASMRGEEDDGVSVPVVI